MGRRGILGTWHQGPCALRSPEKNRNVKQKECLSDGKGEKLVLPPKKLRTGSD